MITKKELRDRVDAVERRMAEEVRRKAELEDLLRRAKHPERISTKRRLRRAS